MEEIYKLIEEYGNVDEAIINIINYFKINEKIETTLNLNEFENVIKNEYLDKSKRFLIKKFYNKYFVRMNYKTFKSILEDNEIMKKCDKTHYKLINYKMLYELFFIKI